MDAKQQAVADALSTVRQHATDLRRSADGLEAKGNAVVGELQRRHATDNDELRQRHMREAEELRSRQEAEAVALHEQQMREATDARRMAAQLHAGAEVHRELAVSLEGQASEKAAEHGLVSLPQGPPTDPGLSLPSTVTLPEANGGGQS